MGRSRGRGLVEKGLLRVAVSLAKDGVVLATENKSSVLHESENKIEKISDHIGCVYSGMGPDFRYILYA